MLTLSRFSKQSPLVETAIYTILENCMTCLREQGFTTAEAYSNPSHKFVNMLVNSFLISDWRLQRSALRDSRQIKIVDSCPCPRLVKALHGFNHAALNSVFDQARTSYICRQDVTLLSSGEIITLSLYNISFSALSAFFQCSNLCVWRGSPCRTIFGHLSSSKIVWFICSMIGDYTKYRYARFYLQFQDTSLRGEHIVCKGILWTSGISMLVNPKCLRTKSSNQEHGLGVLLLDDGPFLPSP